MDNDKTSSCPVCGAIIRPDEKICPHCKEVLWTDEIPDELGSGSATDVSDGTPPPMLGEIHNRDFRPEPGTSPETEEAEPPRRIRGWFYFFVFIVFMSTFRTLVALISEPQTTPFLLYGITSIGLSVYVLVQLAWGKSNAIFLCKSLLFISLTFYVCMAFIIFALSNREPIPLLLVAFIAPIMCLNLAWIFRVQQASRAPVPEQRKVALCIRRLNSYNSSNTGACHYLQFVPSGQLTEHCRMSRFPDRSILSPQSWAADNRPPHSSYGRTPKRR